MRFIKCLRSHTITPSNRRGVAMAFPVAASTLSSVQNYYGKVLSTSKDLKTSACTAAGRPHPIVQDAIKQVPAEIRAKFYGCGAPLPLGIDGLRVLDLGSGSGRDAFVCAKLVGESGSVVGIDMTDEQLDVARAHVDSYSAALKYQKPNLKFVKGYIERLDEAGIADESVDMIISNCVVNLSPDKPGVLREAYRVLAPGGELYFSDVYCDRRLPKHVQENEVCCCGGRVLHELGTATGCYGRISILDCSLGMCLQVHTFQEQCLMLISLCYRSFGASAFLVLSIKVTCSVLHRRLDLMTHASSTLRR